MTATPGTDATPIPPIGESTVVVTPEREYPSAAGPSVEVAVRAACGRVAPVWPLGRFVAVNPYFGLADLRFEEAAELLAAAAGARATMPVAYYLDSFDEGRVTLDDVAAALARNPHAPTADPAAFLRLVRARSGSETGDTAATAKQVSTVADVATAVTNRDWARFTVDRVSAWAAAYFDQGQATWSSADRDLPVFAAWKQEAALDRTPELMGLRGFRTTVRSLPDDPLLATELALEELGVPADATVLYLHALLLRVGGWSAHAARIVWEHAQHGHEDDTLVQFVSVLTSWELGIWRACSEPDFGPAWRAATEELHEPDRGLEARAAVEQHVLLQDAYDLAEQRRLIEQFAAHAGTTDHAAGRPDVQAVFCIDVRSEVFRRHLEASAGRIETLGFAGFFGFATEHVRLGHEHGEAQFPVLLTSVATIDETTGDAAHDDDAVATRRLGHHLRRAWKSFKMGAISCFSFVGPVGLVYLPKLVTDSTGATRPVPRPEIETLPRWAVGHTSPDAMTIPLAERVRLADGALRGMSLTTGFAPLVLVVGHGSTTVNNPYGTGLDCGACGGHTGEVNARVAAAILNDPAVRAELANQAITVPDDTWFVAALHDTTTDEVTRFDRHLLPARHELLLAEIDEHLVEAGRRTRAERAARLGVTADAKIDASIVRRSTDWAQVRPEWGLAGCRAFVAAPRERTKALDLAGRSFLHSYDWRQDQSFAVLELIMTAPMVVASWINLQYYASTVEDRIFGSGNKTLHNVVGQLGVLEGNAGDLRVGLPWQSIHDGETLQHEPLRLAVVIEAPLDAMNHVLAAHEHVRNLCDNGWVHLLALNDAGEISHRYVGRLRWEPVRAAPFDSAHNGNQKGAHSTDPGPAGIR